MAHDIVPTTDAGLVSWFVQMASKIGAHVQDLAVTPADVSALKADALMVEWTHKVQDALHASGKQFTAYKKGTVDGKNGGAVQTIPTPPVFLAAPPAVPPGIVLRTRALVQRIKNSPGYTESIGQDLGIIATAATLAATAPKPTFKAVAQPHSYVHLEWVKGAHSGVVIQSKRPADADWVTLNKDYYSPFDDERAPVTAGANETRQYRMRYLDKDDEVGEWSDVVSAVTIA